MDLCLLTWKAMVSSPLHVQGCEIQTHYLFLFKKVVPELLNEQLILFHQFCMINYHAPYQWVDATCVHCKSIKDCLYQIAVLMVPF